MCLCEFCEPLKALCNLIASSLGEGINGGMLKVVIIANLSSVSLSNKSNVIA